MRIRNTWASLLFALGLLAVVAGRAGAAINVDGWLNDWGITFNSTNGHLEYDSAYGASYQNLINGFTSTHNTTTLSNNLTVSYHIEDSFDGIGNYQVGPLWGGQDFDAEFLGVAIEDGFLYIAISSGQRPNNGYANFEPGDILILTSEGTYYGIEVGGGAGSFARTNGEISLNDDGTTYLLSSTGHPLYSNGVTNLSSQKAGSVWSADYESGDVDWLGGLPGANSIPTQLTPDSDDYVGSATEYVYNFASSLGQHAFIELMVSLDLFENDDEFVQTVKWAPSCGNDQLSLTVELDRTPPVPEPASIIVWVLLGLGASGWCSWRRWRRSQPL